MIPAWGLIRQLTQLLMRLNRGPLCANDHFSCMVCLFAQARKSDCQSGETSMEGKMPCSCLPKSCKHKLSTATANRPSSCQLTKIMGEYFTSHCQTGPHPHKWSTVSKNTTGIHCDANHSVTVEQIPIVSQVEFILSGIPGQSSSMEIPGTVRHGLTLPGRGEDRR